MDVEMRFLVPLLSQYVRVVGLRWVQEAFEDEGYWEMRLAWWCCEGRVWHHVLVRVAQCHMVAD